MLQDILYIMFYDCNFDFLLYCSTLRAGKEHSNVIIVIVIIMIIIIIVRIHTHTVRKECVSVEGDGMSKRGGWKAEGERVTYLWKAVSLLRVERTL